MNNFGGGSRITKVRHQFNRDQLKLSNHANSHMKQQEQANRLVKSQTINAKHQLTKTCKWSMEICIKSSCKHATASLTKMCVKWQIVTVPLSRIVEVSLGVCAT